MLFLFREAFDDLRLTMSRIHPPTAFGHRIALRAPAGDEIHTLQARDHVSHVTELAGLSKI